MARDYKNTAPKRKKKSTSYGSWLSFVSGIALGLVAAIAVYVIVLKPGSIANRDPGDDTGDSREFVGEGFEREMERSLPQREFDFYQILPEVEVSVPDWKIGQQAKETGSELADGAYVLQVGSFKQFEDADRAKAKLALNGVQAKIHRVVINGQDVWHRVHVGPFSDMSRIQAMRAKLSNMGSDFILLKIGDGG